MYRQINSDTRKSAPEALHLGQFLNDQTMSQKGMVYDETGLDGLEEEKL